MKRYAAKPEVIACPNCASHNVLTKKKAGVRWCRRCGHEWPATQNSATPPTPSKAVAA